LIEVNKAKYVEKREPTPSLALIATLPKLEVPAAEAA
jgi:hypothetical protein